MSKSSAPLALSVASITVPGDVEATLHHITEFDNREFGFNHNQTWNALPAALRGVLRAERVEGTFSKAPKRVQNCIVALCRLGEELRLDTHAFADYSSAGLKTVQSIDWDPSVTIRVKGTCWYVENGSVIIPLLQPRKAPLSNRRLSIYKTLAERAFCRGDWSAAKTAIIDLSGAGEVIANIVDHAHLPPVTEKDLREFVETFVEAKRLADIQRSKRESKPRAIPLFEALARIIHRRWSDGLAGVA